MTQRELPDGDTEKTTYGTEMGALWRDDAEERLVLFNNHDDYEEYEVYVYYLVEGEMEKDKSFWDDQTIEEFTDPENEETAWLSGHNFPGCGAYGVFTDDDSFPNCPVCGRSMSPGEPTYHPEAGRAVGFTCEEYNQTHGEHEGYMSQEEAILQGYYVPVEEYLTRRYGEEE